MCPQAASVVCARCKRTSSDEARSRASARSDKLYIAQAPLRRRANRKVLPSGVLAAIELVAEGTGAATNPPHAADLVRRAPRGDSPRNPQNMGRPRPTRQRCQRGRPATKLLQIARRYLRQGPCKDKYPTDSRRILGSWRDKRASKKRSSPRVHRRGVALRGSSAHAQKGPVVAVSTRPTKRLQPRATRAYRERTAARARRLGARCCATAGCACTFGHIPPDPLRRRAYHAGAYRRERRSTLRQPLTSRSWPALRSRARKSNFVLDIYGARPNEQRLDGSPTSLRGPAASVVTTSRQATPAARQRSRSEALCLPDLSGTPRRGCVDTWFAQVRQGAL
jgi:hypothetical protein